MPRILLTNDDGMDAPGLLPFARSLSDIAEVRIVVPDRERSWVGKAITRYETVTVESVDRDGVTVYACSGYPADCVQLGIHTLFPDEPDLVVSGINVGYNHGAAYLQSSGTAGAALEAGVALVPAIAFSAGSMVMPWNEWKHDAVAPSATPMWQRLAAVATAIAEQALTAAGPGDILNIGLPDTASEGTERRITTVASVRYRGLFAGDGNGSFTHAYGGLDLDGASLEGTDIGAAHDEVISITPITGAGHGSASAGLLAAVSG
jgi:5'-nucleotidase